jgi:hypothetical protein
MPQERQAPRQGDEEVWARHPLRDHPRFRLATLEEREADEHVMTFAAVRPGFRAVEARSGGNATSVIRLAHAQRGDRE